MAPSTDAATLGRLVQPGAKCRGPEYLRIIYGPELAAREQSAQVADLRSWT
ncbi:hypothetical protein [Nocardia australiensis]|uniref:hypothetical protein n=1 Tax=Nocardia australiensis TaxID=2887191 RepID=UPI0027E04AF1|nr:hypothetical protein [Nocardia australiensis]